MQDPWNPEKSSNIDPRRPAKLAIAGVVILIAAAAITALFQTNWAHKKATLGPIRVAAAPDGGWWAISHHHLYRFSKDGTRLAKVSLDDLQVDEPTAGLGVLGDGRVLISQTGDPRLQLCSPDADRCAPLSLVGDAGPLETENVALMLGTGTDRFVVSDAQGRRLLLVQADGKVLAQRTLSDAPPDHYDMPYQPRLAPDGELLIPDRRLKQVRRLSATTLADIGAFDARLPDPTRSNELPVDAGRTADGRWWVVNAKLNLCDGVLIEFDAAANPVRRVTLEGLDDVRGMVRIGEDRLLLADPMNSRIDAYDTRAAVQGMAGDKTFAAEQEEVRKLRKRGNVYYGPILGTLVGIPLVGALLLFLLGERVTPKVVPMASHGVPAPITGEGGIAWIALTPEYAVLLRRMQFLLATIGTALVALVLVATYNVFEFVPQFDPAKGWNKTYFAWLFILLSAPFVVVMYVLGLRQQRLAQRQRLGTDGQRFFLDPGSGKVQEGPLSDVVTNGTLLMMGVRLVMLHDARRDHFDRNVVGSLILARLPASAFVSTPRLLWIIVRRQPLKWTLAAVAAIAAIAVQAYFR